MSTRRPHQPKPPAGASSSFRSGRFSRMSTQSSVRGVEQETEDNKDMLQLLDKNGNNVLPKSLVAPTRRRTISQVKSERKFSLEHNGKREGLAFASDIQWSDLRSESQSQLVSGSGFAAMFNRSMTKSQTSLTTSATGSGRPQEEDEKEETKTPAEPLAVDQRKELTDKELADRVNIILDETEIFTLFEQVGSWVDPDGEQAEEVIAENSRYEAVLKANADTQDGLSDRYAQTINYAQKNKEIQATTGGNVSAATQASDYDLFATYQEIQSLEEAAAAAAAAAKKSQKPKVDVQVSTAINTDNGGTQTQTQLTRQETGTATIVESTTMMVPDKSFFPDSATTHIDATSEIDGDGELRKLWKETPEFKQSLSVVERLVTSSIHSQKLSMYRGLDKEKKPEDDERCKNGEKAETAGETKQEEAKDGDAHEEIAPEMRKEEQTKSEDEVEEEEDDGLPTVKTLWSFSCAATESHSVSCIGFNKVNKNIIAVGYGEARFSDKAKPGLICCWSISNPEHPERMYPTHCGVTSLDFSEANPNLLAVGLHDGTVAVYDVSNTAAEPILDTSPNVVKHRQAVWDLKWIMREHMIGDEQGECLITSSTDGHVMQWMIRKGLQHTILMEAKRIARESSKQVTGKATTVMAYPAGVMAFEFSKVDPNIYFLATEDGTVHKCSCSYNERFIGNYFGHMGPVYQLQHCPFVSDLFLTCSADWSIRLWKHDEEDAKLVLQSGLKPVTQAAWSPHNPTVLASITDTSLNVWDLSEKAMDPVAVVDFSITGKKLSAVAFSPTSNCVLTGDRDGRVNVGILKNFPTYHENSVDDQVSKLQRVLAGDEMEG